MRKLTIFLFVTICFFLAACSRFVGRFQEAKNPQENLPELPLIADLQVALDHGLEQYGGMGLSAAVMVPGYETWAGTSGFSHGTIQITPETVFDAGSIHKIFTAVTILQLAEEGTLSLDDRLDQYLPDYEQEK